MNFFSIVKMEHTEMFAKMVASNGTLALLTIIWLQLLLFDICAHLMQPSKRIRRTELFKRIMHKSVVMAKLIESRKEKSLIWVAINISHIAIYLFWQ